MKKIINHLCFDKDGVLIDVHAYWKHTTEIRAEYLSNQLSLNAEQKNQLIDAMGIDLNNGKIKINGPIGYQPRFKIIEAVRLKLIESEIEINSSRLEEIFLRIDEYQQKNNDFNINLLDGVSEFLSFSCHRFVMSIFTSDRKKNTDILLARLGLESYFDYVLGGDSVKNPKPHPEGILKICKILGIKANNTAYISDTVSDLIMAQDAGLPFQVGVSTGLDSKQKLSEVGNLVFNNLTKFSDYLK